MQFFVRWFTNRVMYSCINHYTFAKKILIFYANDALDSSQDLNLFDHLGMSWMFYCCCDFHTTATLWYRCIMRKTVHTLNVCIDDQMLIAIFKTNEKKSQLQWHGPVYDTGKMQLLVKLFFLIVYSAALNKRFGNIFVFVGVVVVFLVHTLKWNAFWIFMSRQMIRGRTTTK